MHISYINITIQGGTKEICADRKKFEDLEYTIGKKVEENLYKFSLGFVVLSPQNKKIILQGHVS